MHKFGELFATNIHNEAAMPHNGMAAFVNFAQNFKNFFFIQINLFHYFNIFFITGSMLNASRHTPKVMRFL